jgi:hypothetical protein
MSTASKTVSSDDIFPRTGLLQRLNVYQRQSAKLNVLYALTLHTQAYILHGLPYVL